MKKTKASTAAPRSKTAITMTVRQPDPEVVVRKVRDDWQALLPQQRILNANRACAELVRLANTQSEVLVPANARCDIGTVVYIKAFTVGGLGETEWQYLAYGDARASGRFLSVEVGMYD